MIGKNKTIEAIKKIEEENIVSIKAPPPQKKKNSPKDF